ncbi:MAG: hypothetical protein EOO28_19815 [Comamonadaceae bacterium]|nr:MAG: hypothetical protein EOO28_19815 [Comamonadaceae bacterium]
MIYMKTELGQAALQTRSVALTPRQRSAFILFDGKRSAADVLQATSGLGVTPEDVDVLVSLGLLAPRVLAQAAFAAPAGNDSLPAPLSLSSPPPLSASPRMPGAPTLRDQASYSKAYPIATRLTAALGLRGFRLNLAVEAAGDLEKLRELAPRIRDAVGDAKFRDLEDALYD